MAFRFVYILIVVVLVGFGNCSDGPEQPALAEKGMVVSAHPLASEVGSFVMKSGGSAMDAAIATEFALAVVFPSAGNIGGGGFMVVRDSSGNARMLDYREKAPLASTDSMFQENGRVQSEESLFGHKAAGVPGTVAGMVKLHDQYGSLPFKELVGPAVRLAKEGFAVTAKQAARLNEHRYEFLEYSTFKPEPFVKPSPWFPGDTLKQPELAKVLRKIQKEGRSGFYRGETASLIVEEMNRCDGLITKKDLKAYEAVFRQPVTGKYKDYQVLSASPPSSGGICLMQMLKMSRHFPLGQWGFQSSKTVHTMTEIFKRAYADRSKHIGDPDYVDVPVEALLDSTYLAEKVETIDQESATPVSELSPGDPYGNTRGNTTHYSIVDEKGNAVSATTTLNSEFGSKVYVGQAGFFLNNEMNDFSIKLGYPNQYGLIQGKKNAIAPGKRMLSSMTPTILEKGDSLFMVVGSPGGSTIITSVFQTILNATVFDMNMQEAVNQGRFHHQWKPDYILNEYNRPLGLGTVFSLFAKGHTVIPAPPIGRVDAIRVNDAGKLEGGADPRGDDKAVGY